MKPLSLLLAFSFLALPRPSWADGPMDLLLQSTWLMVDHEDDEFSSFALSFPGGQAFVTAHHGPSIRENCGSSSFEPKVPASRPAIGQRKPIKVQFRPASARECHYGHDVVITGLPPGAPMLALHPQQDPLRFRERVAIAGYPGKSFRSHECILAGVRPALNQPRLAHYVLECPSVKYDIGGMSGGPVIALRTGRVIGFVNAQGIPGSSGYKRIYVTPLSSGPGGGLEFGIRQFLSSVDCFNGSGMPAGTCTVGDNGYFTDTPWTIRRR